MYSLSPSLSSDSPDLTQVVTGVISVEHQDTLLEIAQQEVDPRPSGTSPPGLHLTRQTSPHPLLLRVRRQEGTVLAYLVTLTMLK